MPSPRRMRLLVVAALATVVFILFYTSSIESEPDNRPIQDFYHKTKHAMDGGTPKGQAVLGAQTGNQAGHTPADKDGDGDVDEDDKEVATKMQERLKAAEQKAKSKANGKALRPDPPSNVIGVGSSAEGQDKLDKVPGGDASKDGKPVESKEHHEAELELNLILKKSPGKQRNHGNPPKALANRYTVIIFSKSYCPFSKRAKGILLEKYTITPEPYVAELDEHPLGPFLQDHLEAKTGRRTVPNIMINGVSIGGSDEIVELDKKDMLIEKVLGLGNKHVEMSERLVSGGSAGH